jgi:hypothetical protein
MFLALNVDCYYIYVFMIGRSLSMRILMDDGLFWRRNRLVVEPSLCIALPLVLGEE